MNYLIIVIIVAVAVFAILVYARRDAQKHGTSVTEEFFGICTFAVDQSVRKNKNKTSLLALFEKKPVLSNADIRETLGFSRRSVVRYLTQLENEGKVEQMTERGRGVTYRQKPL